MSQHFPIILGIVSLLLIAGAAIAASKKKGGNDFTVPAPAKLRTDLLFGYYGTYVSDGQDQVAETQGHVNLVWLWDFLDSQSAAAILTRMPGCFGVRDVAGHLFERVDGKLRPRADAEARLRAEFAHLREAGVLGSIKMLVPVDEPNLRETALNDHMPWAAELMRRVAGEFPELQGILLGCIYTGWEAMPHIGLWDVVGLDFYKDRERIFAPGGKYHQLRDKLRPDQRTMIVPGGYEDCQQDPAPFVRFAHANPEVLIVLAFLWASVPWGTEKGIRDLPAMREKYVAAGRSLKRRDQTDA